MLGQWDRGVKAEINQKEAGAVELDRRILRRQPARRPQTRRQPPAVVTGQSFRWVRSVDHLDLFQGGRGRARIRQDQFVDQVHSAIRSMEWLRFVVSGETTNGVN